MNAYTRQRNGARVSGRPLFFVLAISCGLSSALGMTAGCGTAGPIVPIDGGTKDTGLPEDYVPIPKTEKCTGEATACLSGTFALDAFKAKPSATKVTLYRVFPHGDTATVSWTPVATDGTFAFSDIPSWGHYYLEAEARFGKGSSENAVTSIVGSFTIPAANAPIPLVVRPVFLEVLQQAAAGMNTTLAWASAHLYDPASGAELTSGTVSLTANSKSYPMPYTTNAGGTMSFYATLPAGIAGGTSFAVVTSAPELGSTPMTWTLVGDPATFAGSITSPMGAAPTNAPLTVTWTAEPMASYSVTELFIQNGSNFVSTYTSPTVNAPDVTTETIPASALTTSGAYLLNESYANATCPATADGCVYNVSTAAENVTVN
jgi:hypothetical protein